MKENNCSLHRFGKKLADGIFISFYFAILLQFRPKEENLAGKNSIELWNFDLTLVSAEGFQISVLRQAFSVGCKFYRHSTMFKRRETIISITLAVGIIILTVLQLEKTFFIYDVGQLSLYFLFGCTVIYGVFRLFKDRRQLSFVEKSKPIILALTIIGFFFLLSYLVDSDGGKKRVITAGFNHDLNSVYFQLFDDNRFKLLNSGPLGGTFYRGNYTLHNDTLKISNDSLKNLYPSLTLVLKYKDGKRKYFDPIDTLKSMYQLHIYEDLRTDK